MSVDDTGSKGRGALLGGLALAAAALVVGLALSQAMKPRQAVAPAPPPVAAPAPPAAREVPPPPPGTPYSPEQARAAEERLLSDSAFSHPVAVAAPDVTVVKPDGKPLKLSALKGKVLFVNFWATWCPPCVQEMPSMLELGRTFGAKYPGKFQMIGISGDDGWEPVNAYFKQAFGGAPRELVVARDPDAVAARAFYCAGRGYCPDVKFPETYIVDRSGRVVNMIVGPREWSDPGFRRWLAFLVEQGS